VVSFKIQSAQNLEEWLDHMLMKRHSAQNDNNTSIISLGDHLPQSVFNRLLLEEITILLLCFSREIHEPPTAGGSQKASSIV
jgi:hypothetical protein